MMHDTKTTEKDLDITLELPKLPTKEPNAVEDNHGTVAEYFSVQGEGQSFTTSGDS
jgi:hypothetical protein